MLGMYVAADDGPYILASATDDEAGAPQIANADLVLYAGVGKKKRGSAAGGDLGTTLLGPRVFDGVFAYEAMVDAPTYAPTIDVAGLKVASSCSLTWGRSTGRRNKRRARSYARL